MIARYKWHLLGSGILVLVLAAVFLVMTPERSWLDAEARKAAPSGDFVKVTDGFTHYESLGKSDADPVVLVHGISSHYFIWDKNVDLLKRMGFRVVRYDLFGRGWSDRPHKSSTMEFYERQLLDVVNQLHVRAPVTLVGTSMGGAVAAYFTDKHPAMVKRLVLTSPAGYGLSLPASTLLLRAPLLGDYVSGPIGMRMVVSRIGENFSDQSVVPGFREKFVPQLQYFGYRRTILSSLRMIAGLDLTESFKNINERKTPVLIIWGEEDKVVPFERGKALAELMTNAQFVTVRGAGHLPQYEKPKEYNYALAKFLATKRK